MFYIAVCKSCNHVVSAGDLNLLKSRAVSHLENSHKYPITDFPQDVPLNSLREVMRVVSIRNERVAEKMRQAMKTKKFWHTFRNLNKTGVSNERAN